jgi:hypothetical protein
MNGKINFIKTSGFMNAFFVNFGAWKRNQREATENP